MEKHRSVLLAQLPLVLLWTLAFLIADCGDDGRLHNDFLRNDVFPTLRRMEGTYTDVKFRLRGVEDVKNKIVIVEIDDRAVRDIGRWPWHRDAIGLLVYAAHEAGAKVVGLDIVFPEPDQRVPDEIAELLQANNLGDVVLQHESDLVLQRFIDLGKDRLVLGWLTDGWCHPAYDHVSTCQRFDPTAPMPDGFEKFALSTFTPSTAFDPATTPLVSTAPSRIVGNIPSYTGAAQHAGFLVNASEDPDNIVRRAQLAMFIQGKPYPSMPLEMARVGLGEELELALDGDGHIAKLGFKNSGRTLPVGPTGALSINFRGAKYHFPFVGARDLLDEYDLIPVQHDGYFELRSRKDIFQDAYVLIGVTTAGAYDLRNFPFDSNVPGTEGLASILDNILSGDPLRREAGPLGTPLILVLMTVGAFGFALLMVRLSALPALLSSLGIIGLLVVLDVFVVFGRYDVDLSSVFLLGELLTIFIATVAIKYVVEERGKKFIRSTFSKYLAPTVVDQMLSDPSKLQLGGETRRLTIMMSDLRGFTAMAERMKPAEVLTVLNHYLGTMADIIMDHNGTIDEFIGDAILVIFGAPIEGKDDARRAVACSIAMQRAMKGINEHNAKLGLPKLEMGIALNTGEVIVGNIGSQKHIKYGVVGSHVNLTARIESNTVGGQVLISGTTLDLAGADVKVGEKQMIVAKGFPEPIPAFEVKGIGGEYNLELEEVDLGLVELATPVEVRFRVMKGKNEEGDEHTGVLRSLSSLGGELVTGEALEAFANLKVRVVGADGALVEGDLYAKVLAAGPPCRLRFTAVPPAVEKAITALLAPVTGERSSDLVERG